MVRPRFEKLHLDDLRDSRDPQAFFEPRENLPGSFLHHFDSQPTNISLSRCRLLALVISHSIVDSIACHRPCERSGNSRPEATARRGRSRLIHRLVDDGRIFLHNGRALRCIALRSSGTGERTSTAEPTTATCFRRCRNEKGDRNGRHNSFLHFVPLN
nr:MAG TPA: hypothetical protein [Caudoviricetes sp.]